MKPPRRDMRGSWEEAERRNWVSEEERRGILSLWTEFLRSLSLFFVVVWFWSEIKI